MRRSVILAICVLLFIPALAAAQPQLHLTQVSMAWPEVTLGFQAWCDSAQVYTPQRSSLRLHENGREIPEYELWCPDQFVRAAISVALVLDGSASMAWERNATAKQLAHAIVDMMDGVTDEATVTLFNDRPVTYQTLTTIKPMLRSAIDALGANGGSSLYDALYLSVIEVAFNSANPKRAVLVFTDGTNDSSYRRLDEVITAAQRHRIPIHTVNLGGEADSAELRMIASETGGRYFPVPPNAGQIAALYDEISTYRIPDGQDCALIFHRSCADGGGRELVLEWTSDCGTAADTIRYTAHLDSTTLEPLRMALESDTVLAGQWLSLPLRIVDPVAGRLRAPIAFTLQFDTTVLAPRGFWMHSSSPLQALPVTVTPAANGVRVSTGGDAANHGWREADGELLFLHFLARAPEGRGDTIPVNIAVSDAVFVDGCPDLSVDGTRAVILAHGPVISMTGEHADTLFWNPRTSKWEPESFDIRVRVFNFGDRAAEDVSFLLHLDETKLRLITPDSAAQRLPGGNLPPGEWGEAVWRVMPRAGLFAPDSAMTGMTIYARNAPGENCFCRVHFAEGTVDVDAPMDGRPSVVTGLQIWPNPGSGQAHLILPESLHGGTTLRVADALGRTVLQRSIDAGHPQAILDLSALPNGFYSLQLFGPDTRTPLRSARYVLRK